MTEEIDSLKRVRGRQIAPAVKTAQVKARKHINKHYKSLRDDLAAQHVELGVQQANAIGQSNAAVMAEYQTKMAAEASRGILGTVIATDDVRGGL